jgi:NAD(P)-dependent dehydrogenase (short-subunit alcohol dehydrogenase family)
MTGAAGFVPEATAAEAARGLAKSAARQWGEHGITVNCVAVAAGEDLTLAGAALGRPADVRTDVAAAVAMLAGPLGGFVTGVTVPVDGGVRMSL